MSSLWHFRRWYLNSSFGQSCNIPSLSGNEVISSKWRHFHFIVQGNEILKQLLGRHSFTKPMAEWYNFNATQFSGFISLYKVHCCGAFFDNQGKIYRLLLLLTKHTCHCQGCLYRSACTFSHVAWDFGPGPITGPSYWVISPWRGDPCHVTGRVEAWRSWKIINLSGAPFTNTDWL